MAQQLIESHGLELEYERTITYIHHMYDTRHQIFQFVVGLNTALLAVVFQYITAEVGQAALSLVGGTVTLALTLMARRSWQYLAQVERYARELEERLGFGLIRETSARMPKGIDSSVYLFVIYWVLIVIWAVLSAYHVVQVLS
jgi:hypothetical protein